MMKRLVENSIRVIFLGFVVLVIVVVVIVISKVGSSSKPTATHKLSLESTCADWKRATNAQRLAFVNDAGLGTVNSVPGYAGTLVQSYARFCLRADLRGDLTTAKLVDAPTPQP